MLSVLCLLRVSLHFNCIKMSWIYLTVYENMMWCLFVSLAVLTRTGVNNTLKWAPPPLLSHGTPVAISQDSRSLTLRRPDDAGQPTDSRCPRRHQ